MKLIRYTNSLDYIYLKSIGDFYLLQLFMYSVYKILKLLNVIMIIQQWFKQIWSLI